MSLLWTQVRDKGSRRAVVVPESSAPHSVVDQITSKRAILVGINEFADNQIQHIPSSVRNCEILEERLSHCGFSDVTTLTSATAWQPTRENILLSVQNARRNPFPPASDNTQSTARCDVLLLYVSSHYYIADEHVYIVTSDFSNHNSSTHLKLLDLLQIDVYPHHRTLVVLDGIHAPMTRKSRLPGRSLRATSAGQSLNLALGQLPPTVSILCTSPDFEGSFTLKLMHGVTDLGEHHRTLSFSSLHRMTGSSALIFPMPGVSSGNSIEAHALSIAPADTTAHLSETAVRFLIAFSLTNPIAFAELQHILKAAFPLALEITPLQDSVQPLVIVLDEGAVSSQGPVEDFKRHKSLLEQLTRMHGLPSLTLHKSFYGRLYLSVAWEDVANVLSKLERKMVLGDPSDTKAPIIQHIGLVCRAELVTTYRHYLLCDALARLHVPESTTRIRLEEVGVCTEEPHRGVTNSKLVQSDVAKGYSNTAHSSRDRNLDPKSMPSTTYQSLETRGERLKQKQITATQRTLIEDQVREIYDTISEAKDHRRSRQSSTASLSSNNAAKLPVGGVESMVPGSTIPFPRPRRSSLGAVVNHAQREGDDDSASRLAPPPYSNRAIEEALRLVTQRCESQEREISILQTQVERERIEMESLRESMRAEQNRARDDIIELLRRVEGTTRQDECMREALDVQRRAMEDDLIRRVKDIEYELRQEFTEVHERLNAYTALQPTTISAQFSRLQEQVKSIEIRLTQLMESQQHKKSGFQIAKKNTMALTSNIFSGNDVPHDNYSLYPAAGSGGELNEAKLSALIEHMAQDTVLRMMKEEGEQREAYLVALQKQMDALARRLDTVGPEDSSSKFTAGEETNVYHTLEVRRGALSDVQQEIQALHTRFTSLKTEEEQLREELDELKAQQCRTEEAVQRESAKGLAVKLTEAATLLNELRTHVFTLDSNVAQVRKQSAHILERRDQDLTTVTEYVQSVSQELLQHQNQKLQEFEEHVLAKHVGSPRNVAPVLQTSARTNESDMTFSPTATPRSPMLTKHGSAISVYPSHTKDDDTVVRSPLGQSPGVARLERKIKIQNTTLENVEEELRVMREKVEDVALEMARMQSFLNSEEETAEKLNEIESRLLEVETTLHLSGTV